MREKTVRGPNFDSPVAVNLRRLIEFQTGGSVNAFCKRYGLTQSTTNKIANGARGLSVAQLVEIAGKLGLEPGALLQSGFDPSRLPGVMDARTRLVATTFANLKSERDRALVETILAKISDPEE